MELYFKKNRDEEKERILKKMKNYSVISFDIYDTLILRNVLCPKDIFKIVEFEIREKYKKNIKFYKERQEAEKKIRSRMKNKEDIKIGEIYEELKKKYGKKLAENIKKIELNIEEIFTIRNEFIFEIYMECVKKNKKIIFISDMYLEKKFIERILNINGYYNYEEIYVSGEIGLTKNSGNLFKFIKKNKNIKDNEWIHIGDNFFSDYLMAMENEVKNINYKKKKENKEKKCKSLEESIVDAIVINEGYINYKSYWQKFGVEIAFPIYFSIVQELIRYIPKDEKIYFFSRDGHIIKKVYEFITKKKTNYLYTSRKVYKFANIDIYDFNKILKTVTEFNPRFNSSLTIEDVLKNLNIEYFEIEKYLKKYGLELDSKIESNKKVKECFYEFKELIIKKISEEKKMLEKYLDQEGINKNKKINIFDIGWRGSIQSMLGKYFKGEINGFYLGTSENLMKDINAKGLLFHKSIPRNISENTFKNIMIYELLFSAPEGSLIGFKEKNKKIIPILENVENNALIYKIIEEFQTTAFDTIVKIEKYYKYLANYNIKKGILNLEKMIFKKDIEDLLNFSLLTNNVGIGRAKNIERYVSIYTIEEYIKNRKKISEEKYKNLWYGAVIIKDLKGRYFNEKECEKLYSLKKNREYYIRIIRIIKKINMYNLKLGYNYIKNNGIKKLYYKLKSL